MKRTHVLRALLFLAGSAHAGESRILDPEMAGDLVPSPVKFSVLLPPDYEEAAAPLPLLLNLHYFTLISIIHCLIGFGSMSRT